IGVAQAAVSAAVVGEAPGQYTQDSVDTLNAAIAVAQAVTETQAQSEVDAAVSTLTGAVSAFQDSQIPTPNTYAIIASAGDYGSISPSGSVSVTEGSEQDFDFIPEEGYMVSDVFADGVSQGAMNSYIFSDVTSDHTIAVSFMAIPITVISIAPIDDINVANGTALEAVGLPITVSVILSNNETAQLLPVTWDGGLPVYNGNVAGIYAFTGTLALPEGVSPTDLKAGVNVTVADDITPPVISAHENITAEAASASGATVNYRLPSAIDEVDGGVAVVCKPASGSTFPLGTTTVNCSASDNHENTATSSFFVIVKDTVPPVITLIGEPSIIRGFGTTYTEQGASCKDAVDGAIQPVISGTVDTNTAGTYIIKYDCSDAAGNEADQIIRTVIVKEYQAPASPSGGGSSSFVATPCTGVVYGDWGSCVNGIQYRDVLSQAPKFCTLSAGQQAVRTQACGAALTAGGQVLGAKVYAVGSLLRTPDKRIYVVTSTSTVKYISSLKELWQYRGREIFNVSYEIIAQYKQILGVKIYPDGTLLRGPDMKIYVLINGKKNYISSLKELWQYRGRIIYNVSADVIAAY
ncbi:MAG: DUF5011 domain-containing protein, partial [Patescibacteria group bacterium]|nr:DUF5011 domain-containing protein [Patescibacteria group bacterium]